MLASENFILNFSIFAEGIGFRILIFVSVRSVCIIDIRVLERLFSIARWWYELSCWFMCVLAWYGVVQSIMSLVDIELVYYASMYVIIPTLMYVLLNRIGSYVSVVYYDKCDISVKVP